MRTDQDSEVTSRNACKFIFSEWQPALTNTPAIHHPYPKPSKFCSSCYHAIRGWAAQTRRTSEHCNTNRTALIFPKITNVSTSSAHSSQDNKFLFKHRDGHMQELLKYLLFPRHVCWLVHVSYMWSSSWAVATSMFLAETVEKSASRLGSLIISPN